MLTVEHLNVFYGITEVLRDVSFTVPEGGIFALLGGNGSGKTTIINSLSGMLRPRNGSIKLAGEEICGRRSDQMVRAGLIQVPQGREIFASMTVKDNLEMGAATRGSTAEIQSDIKDLYSLFLVFRRRRTAWRAPFPEESSSKLPSHAL
jgi:branched-chain amino acid transport system ATP-binding protein